MDNIPIIPLIKCIKIGYIHTGLIIKFGSIDNHVKKCRCGRHGFSTEQQTPDRVVSSDLHYDDLS